MRLEADVPAPSAHVNQWDQGDALVLSYGGSILAPDEAPLRTLKILAQHHGLDSSAFNDTLALYVAADPLYRGGAAPGSASGSGTTSRSRRCPS